MAFGPFDHVENVVVPHLHFGGAGATTVSFIYLKVALIYLVLNGLIIKLITIALGRGKPCAH